MGERERRARGVFRDGAPRLVGRAVVGDDQLEIGVVLREIPLQHRGERVGAVVGGDDDGYAHPGTSVMSDE